MDDASAIRRIERLRELRGLRGPAPSAAPLFLASRSALERKQRQIAGAAEAWEKVCPAELIDRTRIVSMRRGVLTIGAADAATRFELDRMLRSGGQRAVARASRTPIARVRIAADGGSAPST